MKRIICIVLFVALLLFSASCSNKDDVPSMWFYYPRAEYGFASPDSVISSEAVFLSESATYEEIIQLYFQGPTDDSLLLLFPRGTNLSKISIKGQTCHITLNDRAGDISGIRLTLALSALAMTCFEMTGVEDVLFTAENVLLDGDRSITISKNDILLLEEFDTPTLPFESNQ